MPLRDFRSLSIWMKLALIFLTLGVILFVLGFATDNWMEYTRYGQRYDRRTWSEYQIKGLWKEKHCTQRHCTTYKYVSPPEYHQATQAMECIGLIGMLLAFLILFLYVFVDSCRRREAMLAVIFCTFGAVVFMVIGFIIFATKLEDHGFSVGWSMGVAIAGCVCTFVAGVMCVLHMQIR